MQTGVRTLRLAHIAALLLAAPLLPAPRKPHLANVAGVGAPGYSGDQRKATEAHLNNPYGISIGPDRALYICEVSSNVIRRVDLKTGIVSTVAGNVRKGYSGDGGPATDASLNEPYEVRFDAAGHMFIVERLNHIVRRVDRVTKTVRTFAGTGQAGFSGDGGPATRAMLREPHSIAFDNSGNLLICDIGNHRLRRVNMRTGIIETIAGTGTAADPRDGGSFRGAPLNGPRAVDVDPVGRIYLAVREGNAVYRLDPDGTIHRVAGTGAKGYSGDGGPASKATLSGPKGIAWHRDALYVADTENHAIRMVDLKTGIISTVAGTGARGDGPEGDPRKAKLARPHGVYVDSQGAVYVGDSEAHRVRKITGIPHR